MFSKILNLNSENLNLKLLFLINSLEVLDFILDQGGK
jgi:hypothetical protein